ncbi:hypothetical protein NC00_07965 [Xanthomonas cannabis pv. phaseoli]|uniref:Uncharacterized protein n=1 Tax=Xanthomonas cannabis pv. phaseoli TaxID=1885902 RepID=A0AB34P9C5_9XANT|nr:hypothetical protein NC00_07965 [Xanthomonas cannabis pv. phaseoli]
MWSGALPVLAWIMTREPSGNIRFQCRIRRSRSLESLPLASGFQALAQASTPEDATSTIVVLQFT